LDFVLASVAGNQFANGDYLIVDNAAIHHRSDTYDLVVAALDSVDCKLIFSQYIAQADQINMHLSLKCYYLFIY
jgi:hypothetical protein